VKKRDSKDFLIIDIGSASVGAAVGRTEKGEVFLGKVRRQAVGAGSSEVRATLEKQTVAALDTLLKEYAGSYAKVHVVVSSPWHTGTIRTVKSKSEKPASISVNTIERLIEKYKNEKLPSAGNVDVEAAALHIKVNNYPTALHAPVTGSDIAVNLYESEMPKAVHQAFADHVRVHIDAGKIAFYTFPLLASASFRTITNESSFIFMNVGGEVTELGIVHGDALQFLGSIPSGYWTVMRALGGKSIGDTRSRLTLWEKSQLAPEDTASLDADFEKAFGPWLEELQSMLKEAGSVVPTPRTLFLMSDNESAGWIRKGIEKSGSMSLSPTIITPATLQHFLNTEQGSSFDVSLALEAIFFHMSAREVIGEPEPRRVV